VATGIKGFEASAAAPHTVGVAIETERKFILHHVPSRSTSRSPPTTPKHCGHTPLDAGSTSHVTEFEFTYEADAAAIQHVAEVDIYSGTLAGPNVAEVEFTYEADAASFNPTDWFGLELTGEPEWSNAALARRGRPDT